MELWYSSAELVGLPGLPGTPQAINFRARKGQWEKKKCSGQERGNRYHFNCLPKETQIALIEQDKINKRRLTIEIDAQKQEYTAKFSALPNDIKLLAQHRLKILNLFWFFCAEHAILQNHAFNYFNQALKNNEILINDDVSQVIKNNQGKINISRDTLFRWIKQYQKFGLYGLIGTRGNTSKKSPIHKNPALYETIVGTLLNYPNITGKKIKLLLDALDAENSNKKGYEPISIVSQRSIERFLQNWKEKNKVIYSYMINPDQYKNKYKVSFGSHSENITRLNQLWEMDSTPADWMLTDGRHVVVQAIDIHSRRLKFHVSKTSSAEAVITLFRKSILDWGIPESVRIDNGKDYKSNRFLNALYDLNIIPDICEPFASEEKGTVERHFKTMLHGILDLLPGFIGHNVEERKIIEARKSFAQRVMTPGEVVDVKMSAEGLQKILDDWSDKIYFHTRHGGLNHKTPFDIVSSWTGEIRQITNIRALDILLTDVAGIRTITKDKGISLDNYEYLNPVLGKYIGEEVRVKRDDADMGTVYIYLAHENKFLCTCICAELKNISRAQFAVAAKKEQKELIKRQADELRKLRREQKRDVPGIVMKHLIKESENVVMLPHKNNTEYTTPALEAAIETVKPQQQWDDEHNESMSAEILQAESLFNRISNQQQQQEESSTDRFHRWLHIDSQLNTDNDISENDKQFHKSYQESSEFKAEKIIHDNFNCEGLKQ